MRNGQRELVAYFIRNGVLRVADRSRRARQGREYHKGYEIRLVAFNRKELQRMRDLAYREDFTLGEAYENVNRWVLPLYGKRNVLRFLKLVDQVVQSFVERLPEREP